jgi:type IV secretory pathway VirB10-like protein
MKMTHKEYPKTIVLKKSIVSMVIGSTILILILILHNLYRSSNKTTSSNQGSSPAVQTIASQSDINWYKDQEIKKTSVSQLTSISTSQKNIAVVKSQAKNQNDNVETKTEQSHQDLLKAMSAPITSNQLIGEKQSFSSTSSSTGVSPQRNISQPGSDQNMQNEKNEFLKAQSQQIDNDYLLAGLKNPISSLEVQAGTEIPGILIKGTNSDLPGQITGQVRSNVYDSISGRYVLIPQGSKLIGIYDSQVAYGQERVLIVWKRIIYPNGQSINLEGMPGVDMSGYSGFQDQVDNHYSKIFGSVVLMSMLSAGAQLSQPQQSSNPWQAPTVGQTMAQSLGTNLANTGTMITAKNINIQPTLKIRPGYLFNISVTKDIIFTRPYSG